MRKEKILEVLIDWNLWEKEQYTGIKRDSYLEKIRKVKGNYILAVVGPRRAGKSTLMRQYLKKLLNSGLNKKNTLFVNLEDPRFAGELSLKLLQDIYETYLEYLKPSKNLYIFLDEIQNVPKWEKFVRSLHERNVGHIMVSGSNSQLLSAEYGSVLTGRYLMLEVYPLSFVEFLMFNNIKVKNEYRRIAKRNQIRSALKEYLHTGGYPQIVLSEPKKEILMTYYEDILNRDIVNRFHIKNIQKLKALTNYYITNISSQCTFNRIKNFLHMPVDTVERYSYYLSYAYLLFFVKRFSFSLKEQEKSPRKVYCIDTGLRNAVGFSFSKDLGKIIENLVFIQLKRTGNEIYYWKDNLGKEVDFVIKSGRKVSNLIQVCWNVEDEEVKNREIKSLLKAMVHFSLKEGIVITNETDKEEKIEKKVIKYIPLWKWLFGRI